MEGEGGVVEDGEGVDEGIEAFVGGLKGADGDEALGGVGEEARGGAEGEGGEVDAGVVCGEGLGRGWVAALEGVRGDVRDCGGGATLALELVGKQ